MPEVRPGGPLIVGHLVWLDSYKGDVGTVRNVGHRFLQAGHEAEMSGEAHNFSAVAGRCYGYLARFSPADGAGSRLSRDINLSRLGGTAGEDELVGVTVVFTATPALGKPRVVVGWYEDATVHRHKQQGLNPAYPDVMFYFSAPADRCFLVPSELRSFEVKLARFVDDKDGPGTDAVYYPGERVRRELAGYLENAPAQVVGRVPFPAAAGKGRRGKRPRQPDVGKRDAVEDAAMIEVERALDEGGWRHSDVSTKNVGWDIGAWRDGFRDMGIEVKGLSGSTATVELTRNEFEKLGYDSGRKGSDRYVVAIVTDALDAAKRRLQAFSVTTRGVWLPFDLASGAFSPEDGFHLEVTEVRSARCSVVLLPGRKGDL